MVIPIFGLIFAHLCAFICGIEVWSAIKSFKNNRPISFAFNFSAAVVIFFMTFLIHNISSILLLT